MRIGLLDIQNIYMFGFDMIPWQTLQVNALFAGNLLTTEYDEELLNVIITLATSVIPWACDGTSAMVYLQ